MLPMLDGGSNNYINSSTHNKNFNSINSNKGASPKIKLGYSSL